jgi:hypothetical protein
LVLKNQTRAKEAKKSQHDTKNGLELPAPQKTQTCSLQLCQRCANAVTASCTFLGDKLHQAYWASVCEACSALESNSGLEWQEKKTTTMMLMGHLQTRPNYLFHCSVDLQPSMVHSECVRMYSKSTNENTKPELKTYAEALKKLQSDDSTWTRTLANYRMRMMLKQWTQLA